jgi:DNA-directed RNA polymerase I, II, and III subunit RPABC2
MNQAYLTKYERSRVIGTRALQLSNGAQPMVSVDGLTDVMDIANKELKLGKMPIIIKRPYPDGTFYYIRVSDMIVADN